MAELTPMKRQYNEIKAQHEDCLLFFRLGDFYEMFDDDAVVASKELEIALTSRDKNVENPEERTPMCGVPYHSSEAYIARLVQKGYKVAICEQLEDPALAKGIVKRAVTRVITPGTVMESSMLEEGKSNYIACAYIMEEAGAICFSELSTGEFSAAEFMDAPREHIINELCRFHPAEVILSLESREDEELISLLKNRLGCHVEFKGDSFDFMLGAARICEQFDVPGLDELGLGESHAIVCAGGALLSYLRETQKCDLAHIRNLDVYSQGQYMELDYTTRRNLELTETLRTCDKKGSLLWVLDRTKTPMGSRLLRSWVEKPLLSPVAIKKRLSSVEEMVKNNVTRGEITESLRGIGDIKRLVGKITFGTANGRDLVSLGASLGVLPHLTLLLGELKSPILRQAGDMDTLEDIVHLVNRAICDEPPFSVREGGILRNGYSEEVDRLRELRDNGARLMAELEIRERERTGIKKLKVGYNRVFGYYIDIPRSADAPLPDEYVRKQTLVSNERYFTQELKNLETELLTARDKIAELEFQHFEGIRLRIAAEVVRIQSASDKVAALDVICSLAEAAVKNNYCMPEIDMSSTLHLTESRHPVVELTQGEGLFVPNDVFLNGADDRAAIVTGPNMAGKSTYMRQAALCVLMAQMGSFVPAKSALIGIVDRVFTRIGASDDLSAGQSTFMVEMTETADILKNATEKSLLILDEIGRGTSTYDGMAIARAVLEYCADKSRLGAKTMFATHYHELTALEGEILGLKNYHITAKKQGGDLIFLRKIVPGAADDSYGIEVAKLAGVPEIVIRRAKKHLTELENSGTKPRQAVSSPEPFDEQISLTDVGGGKVTERLRRISLDTITPLEAMNLLYELKREVEL